jgi:hypothetical protein
MVLFFNQAVAAGGTVDEGLKKLGKLNGTHIS